MAGEIDELLAGGALEFQLHGGVNGQPPIFLVPLELVAEG